MAAGTRFLVLSHTLLNYLSALGAHRNLQLVLTDDCARAVDWLRSTLDALAGMLEASQTLPTPDAHREAALLDALARAARGRLSDGERVLHAQLVLALRLLPPLREQAVALVAPVAGGADGGDAAAVLASG